MTINNAAKNYKLIEKRVHRTKADLFLASHSCIYNRHWLTEALRFLYLCLSYLAM